MKQMQSRMKKELQTLERKPPPGISVWSIDDSINSLQASLVGPKDTPYDSGLFKLEISIPDKYPFVPPNVRFLTPIYHPNIDNIGRICLDILKPLPIGTWTPGYDLSILLASISQLLCDPNPDDGLMPDIAKQYRDDRISFDRTARDLTMKIISEQKDSNDNPSKRRKIT